MRYEMSSAPDVNPNDRWQAKVHNTTEEGVVVHVWSEGLVYDSFSLKAWREMVATVNEVIESFEDE